MPQNNECLGEKINTLTPHESQPFSPESKTLWTKITGQEPPSEYIQTAKATLQFDCTECGLYKFFVATEDETQPSPVLVPEALVTMKVGEKFIRWQDRNCPIFRRKRMRLVK